MTNPKLEDFAREILERIGPEGYDDEEINYLAEKLQFIQDDALEASARACVDWRAFVFEKMAKGEIPDHEYSLNVACSSVIERNIRSMKSDSEKPPANEDEPTPGSGLK
jgi:hypothetical protein